jgi:hypothetical protein
MATQTHSPFETLARVIEHLDDDGRSVRRTEAAGSGGGGSLRATVDVSVGTAADLEPTEATIDDGLSVTFRAPAFPDPTEVLPAEYPRVSVEPTGVRLDEDSVIVTLAVTIGDDDGGSREGDTAGDDESADATSGGDAAAGETEGNAADDDRDSAAADTDTGSTPRLAAARDESVPAYDDTPYLRRLYETCETFAEMSERIEMDVSAETVRRYMTEAGIHSPTSYETAGGTRAASGGEGADGGTTDTGTTDAEPVDDPPSQETSAESASPGRPTDDGTEGAASLPDEQLVADGIGLPEELTLRDIVDAVVDARTVHEVQREVGLEYNRTRQLLTQLNVLDLVMGRVSGDPDRTVTVDIVADRIRQCAPDTA